jgi:hypothetical protein
MWSDIAPARRQQQEEPGRSRRPVVVTLASAEAMRSALEPLTAAGIRVRTLLTPAAALGALAHLRHSSGEAGAIEAYIALDEMTTCVALVHDGMLMAARNLPWGYLDDRGAQPRRREEMATRLVAELAELFASVSGSGAGSVSQVCVCGGLAELRSMTAPLMERLDVEVEPLDSLFGIDTARLPAPADEFRERSAGLRLAWAAVADTPPPINLLRGRRRLESQAVLGRAAVVAGMAAGLSVGWAIERSAWWRATDPKPVTHAAIAAGSGSSRTLPETASTPVAVESSALIAWPIVPPPPPPPGAPGGYGSSWTRPATMAKPVAAVAQSKAVVAPPGIAGGSGSSRTIPDTAIKPVAVVARSKPAVVPQDVPPPPMIPRFAEPAPSGTRGRAPSTQPLRAVSTKPAETKAAETPHPVAPPMPRTLDEPAPGKPAAVHVAPPERSAPERPEPRLAALKGRPAAPETALPFDAVLGSILYSADRRLAIVDGRVVAVGDEIRGARIVDITSAGVFFRDTQGRLRLLTLGAGGG